MISSRTVTIASAVIGGTAVVALFALLTVWLYRRRFVDPIADEEAARARTQALEASDADSDANFKRSYLFDPRKSFRLLAPPQVARIAPVSFRTADAYPDPSLPLHSAAAGGAPQVNEKAAKHTSLSPPPLSSIWRGRQWVTVSRPKTPRTAFSIKSSNPHSNSPATPHNPIAEKVVIGPPEKKTKVQRLSAMITKLKSDFMDVQL